MHAPRVHVALRRVMYTCAGAVGGLVFTALALTSLDFPRAEIAVISAIGLVATLVDVIWFQPEETHRLRASLLWILGFFTLATMFGVFLLLPYGVVIGIGTLLGTWDGWQAAMQDRLWPVPVASALFALGFAWLADTY